MLRANNINEVAIVPYTVRTLRLNQIISFKDAEIIKFIFCQAVHIIMKIHCCMFNEKFVHGDLHTGNIKCVLDDYTNIKAQAFDFGKAMIDVSDSDRCKDLKYIFHKEAIGSNYSIVNSLETFKRNVSRNPSEDNMEKDYLLHKLCNLRSGNGLLSEEVDIFLSAIGNQLMAALKSSTSDSKNEDIFAYYSNLIVSKYAPEAKGYILQKNLACYNPVDQALSLPTNDKSFILSIIKSNLIVIRKHIPMLSQGCLIKLF